MDVKENVKQLNAEIAYMKEKLGIDYEITICAATKYVGPAEMKALVDNGIYNLGENRVQDFLEKVSILNDEKIIWHFIGSLQTNKVKKIINKITYLHSLDRENLALEINKYRHEALNCFVEVNCSEEESKHGLKINEVTPFIRLMEKYDKIRVIGLMTMAENTADENTIRRTFKRLKHLQESVQNMNLTHAPCKHLSMGMSNDYKIAIEEGATFIRIGSRLFK